MQVMQANQLVAQALDPESPLAAQRENELLFAAPHLLAWRSMRPPTVAEETSEVGCSMPPHPFAQRGSTDPAAPTHESCVFGFLEQLHPSQSLSLQRCQSDVVGHNRCGLSVAV